MFVVDPPPHLLIDDDRDEEAFAPLCPHFASVVEVAIRAGWHPAEVVAMVNWALDQTTERRGGDDARDTR